MTVPAPAVETSAEQLVERHRATLDAAVAAIAERGWWSPYAEVPKAYGENALAEGRAAFEAYLGTPFPLDQLGTLEQVGDERSPYGPRLGVTYPRPDVDVLLAAMREAIPAWRDAGAEQRAAVVLEILARLNARSAEIAEAVMHTTGQAPAMAFQAGAPHAQDRALEAVAWAVAEMRRIPSDALWVKPQGKRPPLRMHKRFTVVPRGIALVIGCNTFPTWNGYPGLFASLVCGNPVVVKPSSRAILPLAITVAVAREVLAEAGFSPDLVALAAGRADERLAAELALRPEVRIVDYTGSTGFGEWLEREARQAAVFTEKAGVNTVVIDSTDDYAGMLANLAFTLSLYSGQMCTTTQNLLVPAGGIETDQGPKTFEQVGADLAAAIDGLLGDVGRATAILGAIVSPAIAERLERADTLGDVVLASRRIEHPQFPDADVRTPALVAVSGPQAPAASEEQFGPIALLVPTGSTAESLATLRRTVREHGAITAGVYSTDEAVLAATEEVALEVGVALSANLTQGVYVNQSAAYSDFHGTALNPAANASLADAAFVAPRFGVVQSRRHVEEEG
ncbi:phenylacetic acid degradation protein PaaN [Conexibacter woesei]|uniref:Phenylacetic acid degradation protein paaN n=1 Tax=Conexibacter woesei (strain DSM 14684 / CCUG 47730 / CIP 108061 / JCM 11494 / NBRC 100937 / ID131577) TaxID=469383 RepID=D3F5F5_CONWI|nr:phenylacetic acid degradation protein PaaN [Conexibacter woesei]ADB50622.1 phenylacetic acid degradation protein paaN [Conexibacter woesei DSM 14684]